MIDQLREERTKLHEQHSFWKNSLLPPRSPFSSWILTTRLRLWLQKPSYFSRYPHPQNLSGHTLAETGLPLLTELGLDAQAGNSAQSRFCVFVEDVWRWLDGVFGGVLSSYIQTIPPWTIKQTLSLELSVDSLIFVTRTLDFIPILTCTKSEIYKLLIVSPLYLYNCFPY